jgi:hypothetical protein
MPVRRPEYDTYESYWASAGPRILSYTLLEHRSTHPRHRRTQLLDDRKGISGHRVGDYAFATAPRRGDFYVRIDHKAICWVMNLSDAQRRRARRQIRLAESAFTVEYHQGATHHAADVMSRPRNQPVLSEGIEDELPTCCLEEDSLNPIEYIPVLAVPILLEHQCLDQISQGHCVRMLTDPTCDVDHNEVPTQSLPSGEVAVHVPMSHF